MQAMEQAKAKEAQVAAVQEQLKSLADTVAQLQKPWWKKWMQ